MCLDDLWILSILSFVLFRQLVLVYTNSFNCRMSSRSCIAKYSGESALVVYKFFADTTRRTDLGLNIEVSGMLVFIAIIKPMLSKLTVHIEIGFDQNLETILNFLNNTGDKYLSALINVQLENRSQGAKYCFLFVCFKLFIPWSTYIRSFSGIQFAVCVHKDMRLKTIGSRTRWKLCSLNIHYYCRWEASVFHIFESVYKRLYTRNTSYISLQYSSLHRPSKTCTKCFGSYVSSPFIFQVRNYLKCLSSNIDGLLWTLIISIIPTNLVFYRTRLEHYWPFATSIDLHARLARIVVRILYIVPPSRTRYKTIMYIAVHL